MSRVRFKNLYTAIVALLLGCIILSGISFGYFSMFSVKAEERKPRCNATLDDEFEEDSIIVTLEPEVGGINKQHNLGFFKGVEVIKIVDLTERRFNTEDGGDFRQILKLVIKNGTKQKVLQAIHCLEKLDGVYSAEPNYSFESMSVPNDLIYTVGDQPNLNGVYGIDIEPAWNYSTGSKSVRVGVIDSGIAKHPDLVENLADGWDFCNNNATTDDDMTGHGTAVAGIIGAKGNNDEGITGVNWDITLVPLQTIRWEAATQEYLHREAFVIQAINWATDRWGTNDQIDILNCSISGFGSVTNIATAIQMFPGLFVWSSGNEGKNVDKFEDIDAFNLSNLISVGAIDKYGERSVWTPVRSSNYGNKINIFAPGAGNVEASETTYDPKEHLKDFIVVPKTNGNYGFFDGTSAAAPHVAGVAALMLSIEPTLTACDLKEIILSTAGGIEISIPGGKQTVKTLNAGQAVGYLKQPITNLFGGGTGTTSDPFKIRNERQFRNIRLTHTKVNGEESYTYSYRLYDGIVLNENWTPFVYKFTGEFNGSYNYITYQTTITQAVLKTKKASGRFGLFSYVGSGATIKNLELKDCVIESKNSSIMERASNVQVGLLAGYTCEGATLSWITVSNPKISIWIKNANVGAIAGSASRTYVKNCYVLGGELWNYYGSIGGMAGMGDITYFTQGSCDTTVYYGINNCKFGKIVGNSTGTSTVATNVTLVSCTDANPIIP